MNGGLTHWELEKPKPAPQKPASPPKQTTHLPKSRPTSLIVPSLVEEGPAPKSVALVQDGGQKLSVYHLSVCAIFLLLCPRVLCMTLSKNGFILS